jgi:glutamate-ammonia-ligase adenylyltransferase
MDLKGRLPPDSPFLVHWPETWSRIEESPDPELSFRTGVRWAESEEASERSSLWDSSAELREGFLFLSGASPALAEWLLTYWPDFRPAEWQEGWETRASLERRIASRVEGVGDKEFLDVLRGFHRVEALRIAYLDCVKKLPVEQVTLQISSLADALLAASCQRAIEVVSKRQGKAPPRGGFVVLALGKLGGVELNYSSDVDLNFVYDERTALEGVDGRILEDPAEIERFFTQVAERMVHFITAFTEKGQLYRLDTRLRPEGSSGRLVYSLQATVDYYYSMGRAWERQALIRLRPVAGDFDLAGRLRRQLEAFIFPQTLSAEDIAEIRDLKLQMERLAEDRGPSESHIKIGRGGIRDVEYIVQYLQLIHAAHLPELKVANTFQALEALDARGILKPEEADVLRRGYRFLRRVEHRIQMAHFRQTHRLPEDPRELKRLALGLGFKNVETFRGRLKRHSASIRRVYRLLFEEPTRTRHDSRELPALLDLPAELSLKEGASILSSFGFQDPQRAFHRLRSLSIEGEGRISMSAQKSKEAFSRIVGKLLREVSLQPDPDRALANFEQCVRTLGARSIFYQLLEESDRVLKLFVELCERSSLVVETLRAYPDVFDELVDALLTGYTFNRKSLLAQVEQLQREGKDLEREIFKFKYLHLLLIAIRDLERINNLMTTLLNISELAEAIFQALWRRTLEEAEAKLGSWPQGAPPYVVLGLGKLGGQEMSYKSDLDIVLLYRSGGSTTKDIACQEYFERASQWFLQRAGRADSLGPLLRVDLRLRPLGSHNSLAISVDAWKQYFQSENAATWERQAFLRARPVAGDPALADEVLAFRGEMLLGGSAGPGSEASALSDIWAMRKKIEAHAGAGDLKRGEGGIVDVEFAVQALQLCHGRRLPEILTPNTAAAIPKLMKAGLLDPAQGSELLSAYQFLRSMETRISLVGEAGQSLSTMAPEELQLLVQKIGYKSTGEESALSIFKGELEYYRRRNRTNLRRILRIAPDQ